MDGMLDVGAWRLPIGRYARLDVSHRRAADVSQEARF
jgi:hypothetical protein